MNTSQIFNLLRNRCKKTFFGVFAKDKLPKKLPRQRPLMLICNTDPANKPGQHWIAMYFSKNGKSGEFFDSFGRHPNHYPIFHKFLRANCTDICYNNKQIQSVVSEYCGQYTLFYCLFKHLNYSMNSIIKCFSSDVGLNDEIVRQFVNNHL